MLSVLGGHWASCSASAGALALARGCPPRSRRGPSRSRSCSARRSACSSACIRHGERLGSSIRSTRCATSSLARPDQPWKSSGSTWSRNSRNASSSASSSTASPVVGDSRARPRRPRRRRSGHRCGPPARSSLRAGHRRRACALRRGG